MKLLINSPAPINRIRDSAISDTTREFRINLWAVPTLPPRPPSFSVLFKFGFEACTAGTSPNNIPVIRETASVKPNACISIPIVFDLGIVSGLIDTSTLTPQ